MFPLAIIHNNDDRCITCNKPFKGKAAIWLYETNKPQLLGVDCSKKLMKEKGIGEAPLFDFTKLEYRLTDENKFSKSYDRISLPQQARAYLALRGFLLIDFTGATFEALDKIITNCVKTNELSLVDENKILSLIKAADEKMPLLTVENLTAVYLVSLQIAFVKARVEETDFLNSLDVHLHKRLMLTRNQIKSLNTLGESVVGYTPIAERLFAEAIKKDAKARPHLYKQKPKEDSGENNG